MTSPDSPQPKHLKKPRSWLTLKLGLFSLWNGQSPVHARPRFFRDGTLSWTSATRSVPFADEGDGLG